MLSRMKVWPVFLALMSLACGDDLTITTRVETTRDPEYAGYCYATISMEASDPARAIGYLVQVRWFTLDDRPVVSGSEEGTFQYRKSWDWGAYRPEHGYWFKYWLESADWHLRDSVALPAC